MVNCGETTLRTGTPILCLLTSTVIHTEYPTFAHPRRTVKEIDGRMPANAHECLYRLLRRSSKMAMISCGFTFEGARKHNLTVYASFRMNDAHACGGSRGWYGRSRQKTERLICFADRLFPAGVHGADWSLFLAVELRGSRGKERFLGLFDETLTRYDFDGLELDFSRASPFFRAGEIIENIPTLTQFMRDAQEIMKRHSVSKDRELRLIVRVFFWYLSGLGRIWRRGWTQRLGYARDLLILWSWFSGLLRPRD